MWSLKSPRHESAKPGVNGDILSMLAIMGSPHDQAAISDFARSNRWEIAVAGTVSGGSAILENPNTAVVLLDRDLPESDWRATVHGLSQRQPAPCIILASPVIDDYLFEELVKQGGFDVVAKPIRPDELRRIGGLAFTFWKSRLTGNL